jgi:hypothetical protein
MHTSEKKNADPTVTAAFGAKNRARLIETYFKDQAPPTPDTAWAHVYRLLLWIDQTTGLAHCYESDKCQPGKPWYGRSLAFHDWASSSLDTSPSGLADEIDWLFRRATSDLAAEVLRRASALVEAGAKQRKPYENRGFPRPGEDPELVSIVTEVLGAHLSGTPTPEQWQLLVQRIRQYLMLENKRRNLVGEGFEDVLAAVIRRTLPTSALDVRIRNLLHDLPGFHRARHGDKPNKVDLAILRSHASKRTLVTAKWSLRADRERQFASEYGEYVALESSRKPFEYVFVTNEFDPARLMRACEALAGNAPMFTHVVHINPDALKHTYRGSKHSKGAKLSEGDSKEESTEKVIGYIESGRLISLKQWLGLLET